MSVSVAELDRCFANAGPYVHVLDAKRMVRQVLHQLPKDLKVARKAYVDKNGQVMPLVQVYGQITISVLQTNLAVPIAIWLPYDFPVKRPMVFVVPYADMKIPLRHRHVGSDGRIYVSYLSDWSPATAHLTDLLGHLQSVFSKMPPLVKVPAGPTPTFKEMMLIIEQQKKGIEMGKERKELIHKVSLRLRAEMGPLVAEEETKIRKLREVQATLGMKNRTLHEEVKKLQDQRTACMDTLAGVDRELQLNAQWTADQEARLQRGENVRPADAKSNQLFQVVAQAAAAEDLMFELQRALVRDTARLDVPKFLKLVRRQARAQFLHVALAQKVVDAINHDNNSDKAGR